MHKATVIVGVLQLLVDFGYVAMFFVGDGMVMAIEGVSFYEWKLNIRQFLFEKCIAMGIEC